MAAEKKQAGKKKEGSKAASQRKTAKAKPKPASKPSDSNGKVKQGVPVVGVGASAVGTDNSMIVGGRKK